MRGRKINSCWMALHHLPRWMSHHYLCSRVSPHHKHWLSVTYRFHDLGMRVTQSRWRSSVKFSDCARYNMSVLIKMATWDPPGRFGAAERQYNGFWLPQVRLTPVLSRPHFFSVLVLACVHCSPCWHTHRLLSIELSWEQVWSHDPKWVPQTRSWSGVEGWGGREEVSDQSWRHSVLWHVTLETSWGRQGAREREGGKRESEREKKNSGKKWLETPYVSCTLFISFFPLWRQVCDTVIFHFSFPCGFFPPTLKGVADVSKLEHN